MEAIVDTGFNGQLGVPEALATQLGFPREGKTPSRVADGRVRWAAVYAATVEWIDGSFSCSAVEVNLPQVLIGTALLDGFILTADFGPAKTVEIR
jgi:clan AA aspartic protease